MRTYRYRITIGGGLGRAGRQAFEDFDIEAGDAHTWLIADLDQAALYSALNRIQSFGLELVELTRISAEAGRPGSAGASRSPLTAGAPERRPAGGYPEPA